MLKFKNFEQGLFTKSIAILLILVTTLTSVFIVNPIEVNASTFSESTWNERCRDFTALVFGELPLGGSIASYLTTQFWPTEDTEEQNISTSAEKYIENKINNKFTLYSIANTKSIINSVETKSQNYKSLPTEDNLNLLVAKNEDLYDEGVNAENISGSDVTGERIHKLPYALIAATSHLTNLREGYNKFSCNNRKWIDELNVWYEKYKNFFIDQLKAWQEWRSNEITINSEVYYAPFQGYRCKVTVNDTLTGKTYPFDGWDEEENVKLSEAYSCKKGIVENELFELCYNLLPALNLHRFIPGRENEQPPSDLLDALAKEVTLCENSNYTGDMVRLPLYNGALIYNELTSRGINDWASSVIIPKDYVVELYEHDNFQGTRWALGLMDYNSTNFANFGGDNKVSSVRLIKKGVTFYQDKDYSGSKTSVIGEGEYTLTQLRGFNFCNDWASSVDISDGYVVELYEHDNFQGSKWTLGLMDYNSANFENFGGNDKISSIKVRKIY